MSNHPQHKLYNEEQNSSVGSKTSQEQHNSSNLNESLTNTPEIQKDSDYPEELFELPEIKRKLFSDFYVNNPFCVFIKGDSYLNPKEDKKQLLQKVNCTIKQT